MYLQHNFSLIAYNTFHIDCKAKYFANVESPSDFIDLMKTPEREASRRKLFL